MLALTNPRKARKEGVRQSAAPAHGASHYSVQRDRSSLQACVYEGHDQDCSLLFSALYAPGASAVEVGTRVAALARTPSSAGVDSLSRLVLCVAAERPEQGSFAGLSVRGANWAGMQTPTELDF
jgi:hypothetical protein